MLLFVLLPICLIVFGYGLWLTHCRHYERATSSRPSNLREARKYDIGHRAYMSDSNQYWVGVGAVALAIVLIATLALGISSSRLMVIDEKIAMYQEENAQIETGVNQIVSKYVEHEEATFAEAVENISPTVVFSMYPELKSNTLVEKEIETYVANQKTLRELKASRYDYELCLWWLWFG